MAITQTSFGQTEQGAADLYTLTNQKGMTVKITNYGGIITSVVTPDRNGTPGDVVLGFDHLEGYLKGHPYFGALIGRYGNRIARGKFPLDGKTYTLATNNGVNHLHGGLKGFDKVIWRAEKTGEQSLRLSYLSKDGEEGYPGNLSVTVTYTLTESNEIKIDYHATTDAPTVLNLTNHSYFNLAAEMPEISALGHLLTLYADRYTVVDGTLIPTGELRPVKGTPMDFTSAHAIGDRIWQVEGGYDHNYVLSRKGEGLSLAAEVYEPLSGRYMEVLTTQPGVQFYSGNFLDGSLTGKQGIVYNKHYGFCLETQHFPDSPNHTDFPSVVLKPGETYQQSTVYRFSVR